MSYRKLIKFGNSSHIISIPKSWLERNKLNKGDTILLEENENNELVLSTNQKPDEELRRITIICDDKPLKRVHADIVSAYINGYNIIKINGKNIKDVAPEIKEILNEFIAMEVMEETSKSITIKDFLKIDEVSIKDIIRKMDITTRSMVTDSRECIKRDYSNGISSRDLEVNKLNFLVYKVIKTALKEPAVLKALKCKAVHLIMDWWLVFNIEKVADEAKRVSYFLKQIKLTPQEADELGKLYSKIENNYLRVMEAYYKNDRERAFEIISNYSEMIEECESFFNRHNKPVIGNIIEKLKGMETHIRNLGRLILYHED